MSSTLAATAKNPSSTEIKCPVSEIIYPIERIILFALRGRPFGREYSIGLPDSVMFAAAKIYSIYSAYYRL